MSLLREPNRIGSPGAWICFTLLLLVCLTVPTGPVWASGDDGSITTTLKLDREWTGDFDAMVKRRLIRALVTYSKTNFFLDGFHKRGVTYELMKQFEKFINEKLEKGHLKVHVVVIPVARDQLIPGLMKGLGDIAAASLTITPGRKKQVDFADPLYKGVNEIVVCGPDTAKPSRLEDLSGKEIYVRRSSSYWESLTRVNQSLKKAGKPPVKLKPADEYFEDEDLLEMVNAGLIPMVVVDDYLARFWSQIFKDIILCSDIRVSTGGEIGWMIRKNSPELKKVINEFVKGHKKGSLFGNIMFKRYLENTKWVRNSLTDEEIARFKAAMPYFKEYARKYDLDWMRIAAIGYQESRIDQSKRSPAGAVGVMQLLPSTAAGDPINIPAIEKIDHNIHAGVKYLRWIYQNYFEDEKMDPLNKALFTIASYNAGAGRIQELRQEASKMGLDPNRWFQNVEVVAAERIGRETVQYVSNIYKYYVAYRLISDQLEKKEQKTQAVQQGR